MKTRADMPASTIAALAGRAEGFTLVELIVAVAAVALLTVGIGQIFSSVGRLVGAGTALAETDQFARSIEGQMRADFDALSRLRADETFLVIRNRRIGDLNHNDSLDGSEQAIYLNSDDKEFDRKEAIAPYAAKSRAITSRLDEIMFIAAADEESVTSQRIPPNMVAASKADHVRIYYGHGLRPPIDRRFDPLNPPARVNGDGNVPPRLFFADGDFGTVAGQPNRYYATGAPALFQTAQGRNEYAGDWLLLRQPLLLVGGLSAGYSLSGPPGARPSEWMYSPFIRGLECVDRPFAGWGGTLNDFGNTSPPNASGPYARVLYHGRTDVCAQGLTEVKRWLEGLTPGVRGPTNPWSDSSAFEGGLLDEPTAGVRWDPNNNSDSFPSGSIDAPLWQRESAGAPDVIRTENHRDLISAIAGCLARFQAEDDPPLVERRDVLTNDTAAIAVDSPRPRFQQVMDMHAVVASRVSNFEIAWTDGNTWQSDTAPGSRGYDRKGDDDPTDANGDGDLGLLDNLHRGDVIWYDMDFTRYFKNGTRNLRTADTDDHFHLQTESQVAIPEVFPGDRSAMLRIGNAFPNRYDIRPNSTTGAADPADPNGNSEYLAVFPFRQADGAGNYGGAYLKPQRIRVRMTVNDAQFRLPGGRQYEFEFPVNLK